MGGFVRKVFGGGSKPDTSAYDRQLAEQKAAAEKAEKEAAELKAQQKAEEEALREADARAKQGRAGTILTGASGDGSTTSVKRKSLLGA